jgi:hypothetical protein
MIYEYCVDHSGRYRETNTAGDPETVYQCRRQAYSHLHVRDEMMSNIDLTVFPSQITCVYELLNSGINKINTSGMYKDLMPKFMSRMRIVNHYMPKKMPVKLYIKKIIKKILGEKTIEKIKLFIRKKNGAGGAKKEKNICL